MTLRVKGTDKEGVVTILLYVWGDILEAGGRS